MQLRHLLPRTPAQKFTQFGSDFSEYLTRMRKIISDGRLDLTGDDAKDIVDENAPFELIPKKPNGKAVILTHGLYDSPFSMRDLAYYFVQEGYLVRSILLPGHGTVPGDLLRIHSRDWQNCLRFAIDVTSPLVDEIILAGYSLGSALSIILHTHSPKVKAIVAIAPALKPLHPFAHITKIHNLFTWVSEKAKFYLRNRALISHVKYFSTPYHAAKHSIKMMKRARKTALTVPIFMAISADDETVSPISAKQYFIQNACDNSRYIFYTKTPSESTDPRMENRTSCYPEKNIADFSHSCLPIAPANPFLGEQGKFIDYVHYENAPKPFGRAVKLGAISTYNLTHYVIQRLNYNPDYAYMTQAISQFLDQVNTNAAHTTTITSVEFDHHD